MPWPLKQRDAAFKERLPNNDQRLSELFNIELRTATATLHYNIASVCICVTFVCQYC